MKVRLICLIMVISAAASGCTPKLFKGMEKVGSGKMTLSDKMFVKVDSQSVYNMQIDFRENSFAGLLVVSPGENGSLRTVFTTYFGMSVFDFEITHSELVVNSCMEQMNRKVVLSIFERDFRRLFGVYPYSKDLCKMKAYQKGSRDGYKVKTAEGKVCYLIDNEKGELCAASTAGCIKGADFKFENGMKGIEILHKKLGLKLKLDFME
ncbi:MAG: hypothetical protein U0L74_00245 [Paludibacteraceae bacterium]|nr:hypothetical protein [Paludibacteraceae bacterium]